MKVLALNDNGISLSDQSGLLVSSPAYVLSHDGKLEFGELAASKSRLYPLSSNNEFWHRLSMESLSRPLGHFRHYADIAYAHLLHIADEAGVHGATETEVMVVVPGSFSHQQLSVLLGVLQASPFKAVSIVDAAVLGSAGTLVQQRAVYLDLQLHQALCSVVSKDPVPENASAQLTLSAVLEVPSVGWSHLANSLARLVTEAFIQQCRFNPQHNARWEQALFDQLPAWLQQRADAENKLLMEIETESGRYQAKLTQAGVEARLQPFYREILVQLNGLLTEEPLEVLVSERFARLPGLMQALTQQAPEQVLVRQEPVALQQLTDSCLRYQEQLISDSDALHFITRLQLAVEPTAQSAAEQGAAEQDTAEQGAGAPSHILLGHKAYQLEEGLQIVNDSSQLGLRGGKRLKAVNGSAVLATIDGAEGEIRLHCNPQLADGRLQLNGESITGQCTVHAGDRLSVEGMAQTLQLIQVHNDQT